MNSSFYKIISLLSVAKLLCWQSFKATRIQRKVFDLISFSAVLIFYLITQGSGLEFGYIDVRDEEEGEEHTLLNHFVLDGNVAHANLLRFALTEQNVDSTTVLVRFQQNDIYGDNFDDHCTMVLAIENKERKICKSKWLDFTHFSTNYYFFGLYCCETANI